MNKQIECCSEAYQTGEQANLVLEAQRMVFWAAEPAQPGERIGAQILRAADELRLHYGVVWRAWYQRSGPEIYPTIHAAHIALVERRHVELLRRQASPWNPMEQRQRRAVKETLARGIAEEGHCQAARAKRAGY